MIKAIVFDVGQTLTYYPIPLNWSKLYRPAFETVSKNLGFAIPEEEYGHIGDVLTATLSDVPYGMDNETNGEKDFGQDHTINDLSGLVDLIAIS